MYNDPHHQIFSTPLWGWKLDDEKHHVSDYIDHINELSTLEKSEKQSNFGGWQSRDNLNEDGIFEYYDGKSHDEWIKDIDLVIVFDVGDFLRIRTLVDVIKKYQIKTMNIDHHPHPEQNAFNYNIVDLSAAATGSMVYDYLKVARKSAISKNSLLGIYTAVMTDTGCFRHSNTDNKCHEICLLYTSPSPRDVEESRMPSSA